MNYRTYLTKCACGNTTSKAYARANGGKCKACVTGVPRESKPLTEEQLANHPLLCPNCHEHLRTPYQKMKGYKCDSCVAAFDRATNYAECPEYRFGDSGDY